MFAYLRNTTNENFTLRNEIALDIGNSLGGDRFGESLAITKDGARIFASAPSTGDIVKLTLTATARVYTRGTTVIGSESGATGTIIDVDWDTDVIYVKNTGNTDFIAEPLDVGDSSSTITVTAVRGSDNTSTGAVHWLSLIHI